MSVMRINPTRMELTRIKRRLVTANRGHKLLKDKRDEMVRQFIILIRKNMELRQELEKELAGAFSKFAVARALMEPKALEQAMLYPARHAQIDLSKKNVMSVQVPRITVDDESLQETTLAYGFLDTSEQLDGAISELANLLPKMIELAEVEKACNMLADEIEKTRRRVNALEYVMIPQFEETIRFISMKLDENERSSITRLMKVKDIIADRN